MTKRERIFLKSNGRCWYCGDNLKPRWHIDHLEPIYRYSDGTKLDHLDIESNMVPSCQPCNNLKNVFTLEQFRYEISVQIERARKQSVNFRTAERFQFIEINQPEEVLFYFEKENLKA